MWSANSYYYKVVREGNFALSLLRFCQSLFYTKKESPRGVVYETKIVDFSGFPG
jgi:hypothetical protein